MIAIQCFAFSGEENDLYSLIIPTTPTSTQVIEIIVTIVFWIFVRSVKILLTKNIVDKSTRMKNAYFKKGNLFIQYYLKYRNMGYN